MNDAIYVPASRAVSSTKPVKDTISLLASSADMDQIREAFLTLHLEQYRESLVDLGNMTVAHESAMGTLMIDISESLQTTVIGLTDRSIVLHESHDFTAHFFAPVAVTNRPTFTDSAPHIGLQRHYVDVNFDQDPMRHVSLGDIRDDIQSCEVFLRTADYVSIDLGVLRLSDNLGCSSSTTAGLTIEELCMIAKYTGASPRLKVVTIHGYDANNDAHGMMAKNAALVIWYLLEGYQLRMQESHHTDHKRTYTVIPDHLDSELLFIENVKTGRWWVRVHSDAAETTVDMPCTKSDYEAACQNEISDRLLSIISRV